MKEPGPLIRGGEFATITFLERVQEKRTIVFAQPGSEELRYLDATAANANAGGEDLTHIILRLDARTIEVWEEYLHGTQKSAAFSKGLQLMRRKFM